MTATILKTQFRKCISCENCFRPCFENHIVYDYEPEEESGCERCELYNYKGNEHTFRFIPMDEVIATLVKAERTGKVYDEVSNRDMCGDDTLLYDIINGVYFYSKQFEFEDGYADEDGDVIDCYIDFKQMSKIIRVYDEAVKSGKPMNTKQDFTDAYNEHKTKHKMTTADIKYPDFYDD